MFSVHTMLEEFETETITGPFGVVDEEKSLNSLNLLRFRDGLVWTVGLTEEMKLCFQIPPEYCGRFLS